MTTPTPDDGGSAFPDEFHCEPGMSLRDYFAARAMASLINEKRFYTCQCDERDMYFALAKDAYFIADAMIAARNQTTK